MAIGLKRLRQLRESRGWTQQQLGSMCDVNKLQIHRYESGINDPPTDKLKRLAEVFGVSSDYLIGLTDDPHVQIREPALSAEERIMVEIYRREGWIGIARLSVERLAK